MSALWEERGGEEDKRECKRRGRSGEEERWSGKMKRRERESGSRKRGTAQEGGGIVESEYRAVNILQVWIREVVK